MIQEIYIFQCPNRITAMYLVESWYSLDCLDYCLDPKQTIKKTLFYQTTSVKTELDVLQGVV